MKQLGNNVLENKYTEIAAGTLDDAIITVDKYMDHYLPDDDLSKDGIFFFQLNSLSSP